MTKKLIWLLLLLINFGRAQVLPEILAVLGHAAIDATQPKYVPPKFHNGFIVINSDTIKGQVKIGPNRIYYLNDSIEKAIKLKNKSLGRKVLLFVFHPFIRKDSKKNSFKMDKVTFVRIFAEDTSITKNGYMDFFHIKPFSSMFRRIYSGSFDILDHNYNTDENPGYIDDGLVVMDNGIMIQNSQVSPKKYLINCINKKFGKEFKKSDFKSKIDVINWLNQNDKAFLDH